MEKEEKAAFLNLLNTIKNNLPKGFFDFGLNDTKLVLRFHNREVIFDEQMRIVGEQNAPAILS